MNDSSDPSLNGEDETINDPSLPEALDNGPSPEDEETAAETKAQDDRFQEGQILRFIRVRFPGNNRSFAFLVGKYEYTYGQKVVAMSDRGMGVGFVNSFPYEVAFHKGLLPVRGIAKAATDEDLVADRETFRQEKRLETICYKHVDRHKLDMQLTNVELTQAGKKAIFQFTAPTRIDFRGLVHDLVGELKMRVELRQVSVRDRAAAVGGLGPCGRELCCSSFLAKYGNVGIKLAKNQDLSLNSSKINGVCGQLKCCLTYEDEVYQEKRKKLPRDNGLIKTKDGFQGKVIRLHILEEQFEMISPEGIIRRYVGEMWDGPAEGLEMPRYFENGVTDNSKTVIGLDEVIAKKEAAEKANAQTLKDQTKSWADELYQQLFGEKTLGLSMPELLEPEGMNARKVMPDEEEEIAYVPTGDDALLDDEEGDDEEGDDEDLRLDEESESAPGPHRPEQPHHRPPPPRRDERPRDDRPRNDGNRPNSNQRSDRSRDERSRDERPRDERPPRGDQRPNNNQGNRNQPRNNNRGGSGGGNRGGNSGGNGGGGQKPQS